MLKTESNWSLSQPLMGVNVAQLGRYFLARAIYPLLLSLGTYPRFFALRHKTETSRIDKEGRLVSGSKDQSSRISPDDIRQAQGVVIHGEAALLDSAS